MKILLCKNPLVYSNKGNTLWLNSLAQLSRKMGEDFAKRGTDGTLEIDWRRVLQIDLINQRNIGEKGRAAIIGWAKMALVSPYPKKSTSLCCPYCGNEILVCKIIAKRGK